MQCELCLCDKCVIERQLQSEHIDGLREAVKALGDCIMATCKRHKMEVATLAILNNPIAAAAVREAAR